MATYKITAVTRSGDAPHDHVTSVDIGPHDTRTVAEVRDAIQSDSDVYYVYGGGEPCSVEVYTCDCGVETLRSLPGSNEKNDLSAVPNK